MFMEVMGKIDRRPINQEHGLLKWDKFNIFIMSRMRLIS